MSKVVLISNSGYDLKHDDLLRSFLDQNFELFCVAGIDCELWEDAMDRLAIGNGEEPRFIITTSHPEESAEEVIAFAKMFSTESKGEVQVVNI